VFRDASVVRSMVLGRDPLRLAEAYFRSELDIEGDFLAALGLKDQLQSIQLSTRDLLGALINAFQLPASSKGSPCSWSGRAMRHGRAFTAHSKRGD
jgi:cyclopropane-fatty-acyl-phospholipid synthase